MCQLLTLKIWGPHRGFLEKETSFGLIELKPATTKVHLMLVQDLDLVVVGAFDSFALFCFRILPQSSSDDREKEQVLAQVLDYHLP